MDTSTSKNKKIYIITLFIFLIGISFLIYSAFSSSNVYFLNVSEAIANTYQTPKKMRLFGTVDTYESSQIKNSLQLKFSLLDKDDPKKTITVYYTGIIPDAFKKDAEVIAEGEILPDHTFQAKTIMTKCPSKYQK